MPSRPFRHKLEKHQLGEQFFENAKSYLSARTMKMRQGTIIDANLITAPTTTYTRAQAERAGATITRVGENTDMLIDHTISDNQLL